MGVADTRKQARAALAATERALKKHVNLIKDKPRVASVVATMERLRGHLFSGNDDAVRADVKRLNSLTRGFARRAMKKTR